ncbi:hypothetical protein M1271_06555 [Patescibacteria group bacterium]|nr:hypothetical protein [Patescibacteria group bacterium]MCL5797476.1 hypothetical protein [Patescibacteria group bacterium]
MDRIVKSLDSYKKSIQNLQVNSGQVVLILVLITVVGLTVGLSLISRTVTDVRISSQIEQSSRAFSAAEAGVETALQGAQVGSSGSLNVTANTTANYNVTMLGGNNSVFTYPYTETNDIQTLWLNSHTNEILDESATNSYSPSSSLTVCWGSQTTKSTDESAIEVSIYYKDAGGQYYIAKGAYDPDPLTRTPPDNFTQAEKAGGYCGGDYRFRQVITPTSLGVPSGDILLVMRIQPLFSGTVLAVQPSATLPQQGSLITSVGQTSTGIVRKIQVTQGYKSFPTLFDMALFCENCSH